VHRLEALEALSWMPLSPRHSLELQMSPGLAQGDKSIIRLA